MKAQLPVFNYSFKNQSDNSADIFIDGDIVDASTQEIYKSWYGDDTSTSYKSFRDQVNNSNANIFNVYINSGGGQITEAMAIHDLLTDLQSKGKTVNTVGRGIIASAATYILMAGKKPSMSSNSFMMIHNASGIIYGTVNEIENYAVTLRKFNDQVNTFYQNATGLSKTVIGNMMDSETWMTAIEAKEKNFVKEVTGEATFSNSIKPEKWPFQNTAILNSYNSFTKKNPIEMDTTKVTEAITNGFNSLMEKLGLKEKSNDENVQNAFKDFSASITNALGEIKAPDEESIKKIVNTAVADGLKKIGENEDFKNAISNSLKEVPESFKNAITEAAKNNVTKEDFNKGMADLTKAVTDKMGGASTGEEKDKENKGEKKKGPKNRFAEQYGNYYQN